jgi:hypothetical protein
MSLISPTTGVLQHVPHENEVVETLDAAIAVSVTETATFVPCSAAAAVGIVPCSAFAVERFTGTEHVGLSLLETHTRGVTHSALQPQPQVTTAASAIAATAASSPRQDNNVIASSRQSSTS